MKRSSPVSLVRPSRLCVMPYARISDRGLTPRRKGAKKKSAPLGVDQVLSFASLRDHHFRDFALSRFRDLLPASVL
jgi:hypothetical protein